MIFRIEIAGNVNGNMYEKYRIPVGRDSNGHNAPVNNKLIKIQWWIKSSSNFLPHNIQKIGDETPDNKALALV